jgi:MFS transporter, PAT family, beta-lactamase induction signal transducer AmpG
MIVNVQAAKKKVNLLFETFRRYWLLYINSRMVGIFFLAISTGLPVSLGVDTFKVWMWEEGTPLELVALLNIASFPYIAKVFFGPIVDQFHIPILHKWLGRRRSWSLVSQLIMLSGFLLMGQVFATQHITITIGILILISFASAFNHTALNAYRVEIMTPELNSIAAVVGALGYRLAKLIAGAGALLLAAAWGWNLTYFIIPMIFVITIITTLLVEEPPLHADGPKVIEKGNFKSWFRTRLLQPFKDFVQKHPVDWKLISLFILLYGIGDFLLEGIATIFYLDIGFNKVDVANIAKAFGLICTIIGGVIGGHLVLLLGIHRMIYITTILHCFSYLSLLMLAHVGDSLPWLYTSVLVEFITEGMKTSALVSYVSLLCGKTYYTASQYALFSSMKVLLRPIMGAWAGVLATYLGWSVFFGVSMLLSLLPLIFYYHIKHQPTHHAPVS